MDLVSYLEWLYRQDLTKFTGVNCRFNVYGSNELSSTATQCLHKYLLHHFQSETSLRIFL